MILRFTLSQLVSLLLLAHVFFFEATYAYGNDSSNENLVRNRRVSRRRRRISENDETIQKQALKTSTTTIIDNNRELQLIDKAELGSMSLSYSSMSYSHSMSHSMSYSMSYSMSTEGSTIPPTLVTYEDSEDAINGNDPGLNAGRAKDINHNYWDDFFDTVDKVGETESLPIDDASENNQSNEANDANDANDANAPNEDDEADEAIQAMGDNEDISSIQGVNTKSVDCESEECGACAGCCTRNIGFANSNASDLFRAGEPLLECTNQICVQCTEQCCGSADSASSTFRSVFLSIGITAITSWALWK